jgi:purine-cytosine permease-like protein
MRPVHLRMPSIDKGVQSFLWAVVFFLYLFFGMKAIGVAGAVALVISLVAAFLIFLFVRTRGEVRD